MRKDVKFLFGIMKGIFFSLRYGFRFYSITDCDNIWLTCCGLHNILFDIDVLHLNLENGVSSDWGKMYKYDISKITPFTVSRLKISCSSIPENLEHGFN